MKFQHFGITRRLRAALRSTTALTVMTVPLMFAGAAQAQQVVNTNTNFVTPPDGPFSGILVTNNAILNGTNLVIGPGSPNNTGLLVESGQGHLVGGSIVQSGVSSVAGIRVNLFGASAVDNATGRNLQIEVNATGSSFGDPSAAVYAYGGTIRVFDSTLAVTGTNTYGLLASGNPNRFATVYSTNSIITTNGMFGLGAFAYSDGTGRGVIHIDAGTIGTKGLYGYGLLSQGVGSEINVSNSASITTEGVWAIGAYAVVGGLIKIDGSSVATSGDSSVGAYAYDGSNIIINNSSLKTTGPNADGAYADTNSMIQMNGASVVTQGAGARGLVAFNGGTFQVDNSSINASSWAAAAEWGGAPNFFTLANTTMTGGDGLLNVTGGSIANFQATNSVLTGRVLTESGSQSIVSLLGGTLWNMNADSNVTSLTNNASTIAFAPGGAFKTLTVDGNYIGNSGIFVLNTQLGGDASPTDRLVVKGDTSGSSLLRVVNAGGAGAPTTEGIKVVQVDGASNGTFALLGNYVVMGQQAVVVGPYAYTLQKNGIADPTDGDWYLRSAMPGGGPILQPGAPLYETMPRVALGMMGLPTLQQRVGNRYWPGSAAQGYGATTEARGYWGRMDGEKIRTGAGFSTSAARVDQNQWRAETGLDLVALQGAGGTFISGLTFHYGQANANIQSPFGVGRNETQGYGFGGTATWYGDGGFYADAQARVSWLDTDLNSHTLNMRLANGAKGLGYSLGLELGQRMPLTANWSLVPQAQLIFANVNYDNLVDPFGSPVNFGNDDSLLGRFGIALQHDRQWRDRAGNLMRTSFYGVANLYREFLDGTSVSLAGLDLRNEDARTWMGGGLGGSFNMNGDAVSLYGEVTAAANVSNGSGDSYRFGGKGGLRARW